MLKAHFVALFPKATLKLLSTLPRGGKNDQCCHFRNTFGYFSCKLLF